MHQLILATMVKSPRSWISTITINQIVADHKPPDSAVINKKGL